MHKKHKVKTGLAWKYCKHKNMVCLSNIEGDFIDIWHCRSVWRCEDCRRAFFKDEPDLNCKIINFGMGVKNE